MTFMNDNDFMLELTEEELTDVNGAGGYDFSSGCGTCGFTVPVVSGCSSCGCSTCGFTTFPFISAYSNVTSNTFAYNLSIASSQVNKTSYFTMIG